MTQQQQATIRGDVCFRPGDGALLPVPDGPVAIELTEESATLSWTASDGSLGSAAIPRDEYDRYVKERKIRLN